MDRGIIVRAARHLLGQAHMVRAAGTPRADALETRRRAPARGVIVCAAHAADVRGDSTVLACAVTPAGGCTRHLDGCDVGLVAIEWPVRVVRRGDGREWKSDGVLALSAMHGARVEQTKRVG